MANEGFEYWTRELVEIDAGFVPSIDFPGKQERMTSEDVLGFWRLMGARTKPDAPIAIWRDDGQTDIIIQFGRKTPERFDPKGRAWHEFMSSTFLKCAAVRRRQWNAALETGKWEDGKISREQTVNEQLGLDEIPTTPASQGGNMPEGEDADKLHAQIEAKIGALTEKARAIGTIDTLDKANAAAEILEPLRGLYKQGENRRKEEVAPFDEGRAKVQAKWSILGSAKSWGETLVASIQKFRDKEKARLEAEERKRQDEERRRIAEETRIKLAAEAAERHRQAEQMGMTEDAPSAEDIAAQAEEIAAEAVAEQAAAAAPIEAPRVGTAHGRGVSAPKIKTATVIDAKTLALHLISIEDAELWECLQKRANAAARANIALPGCEIEK